MKLGKVLKNVLIIGFIIACVILIFIPFTLSNIKYAMFVAYPNGITMLAITYQFIKLFKSLEDNNPFTHNNVKILKNTSMLSLIESILWLIDLIFLIFVLKNTYINYIIVLIFLTILFFGVNIALLILSELFKQATTYKEENDLTI
jgi:hypothetical protein